jgi:hypothetical protein
MEFKEDINLFREWILEYGLDYQKLGSIPDAGSFYLRHHHPSAT